MSLRTRVHRAIDHKPRRFDPEYQPELAGKRLAIGWRPLRGPARYWAQKVDRLKVERKRIDSALKRAEQMAKEA